MVSNKNALENIYCRLFAISAAVRGADFCDLCEQKGILHLLDDVLCALDDFIKELKGEADGEGEANG
jgi:hypothetical protein